MALDPVTANAYRQLASMVLGMGVSSLGPTAIAGSAPRARRGTLADFLPTRTENTNPMRSPDLKDPENVAAALEAAAAVSEPIDFDAGVVYIPGDPQRNAGLVRTPENLEAFLRQTPEEHRQALMQFFDKPQFADRPEMAARLGMKAEEGLAKWWNDQDPRRAVTPTSSAVSSARIGPNGDIYIKFNPNGKEYQYEGSPDPVEASRILQQLVTAESIGRSVNSWTGDWGRAHTYLPKG